ncbi:hypothetical protein F5B21DRAFT_493672 [Xylaria acuta]|nr:hypothetical protein F5B21DRAFT_493672 [Xylaria acuta]
MDLNTARRDYSFVTVADTLVYIMFALGPVQRVISVWPTLPWEGGRGNRCDFWRVVSARVLEHNTKPAR